MKKVEGAATQYGSENTHWEDHILISQGKLTSIEQTEQSYNTLTEYVFIVKLYKCPWSS